MLQKFSLLVGGFALLLEELVRYCLLLLELLQNLDDDTFCCYPRGEQRLLAVLLVLTGWIGSRILT